MKKIFSLLLLLLRIFSSATEITLQDYYQQKIINKDIAEVIYQDVIRFSREFNVDPALITAIIEAESNFVATAISEKGAQGLMQIMPSTAEEIGINTNSINGNIYAGIKYFSFLLKKYNGDITLSLAGYNAGPGNVNKYDSIPPFSETQNYIQKVINIYKTLNKDAENYKFNENNWNDTANNNVFGWDNDKTKITK